MTNLVVSESISVGENALKPVTSYKYLNHQIRIGKDHQTSTTKIRIDLSWVAIEKLRNVLKSKILVC